MKATGGLLQVPALRNHPGKGALQGQAYTAVGTFYYRRSIPLSNTFHQACVLCHTNFTDHFFKKTENPPRWTSQIRPWTGQNRP